MKTFIRVLVYKGNENFITNVIENRTVKGIKNVQENSIREYLPKELDEKDIHKDFFCLDEAITEGILENDHT